MKQFNKVLVYIGIAILLILYLIIGKHYHLLLFCPIYKLTGLYCPGCGITRMLLSLLEGNFYQAFRYNPLIFILIPFFILYFIDVIIANYKNRKTILQKYEPYIWYILIAVFIIYGILRNIPLFDFLKPTNI